MSESPFERGMPEDFPEMLRQFIEEVERDTVNLEAEIAASKVAYDEADEQRAEDARAGKLGPEWRVIQQRIDAGQTSALAVLTGEDMSAEAQKLRDTAHRNLQNVQTAWEMQPDGDEARPEERAPRLQMGDAARGSQAHFEQVSAQIAEMIRNAQNGGRR